MKIPFTDQVVKKSADDKVLVVGAGVTLTEALNAAEKLAKEGINIRVLDPFTVKPLDCEAIVENAKEVKGKVVTVEDHYIEGMYSFLLKEDANRSPAMQFTQQVSDLRSSFSFHSRRSF